MNPNFGAASLLLLLALAGVSPAGAAEALPLPPEEASPRERLHQDGLTRYSQGDRVGALAKFREALRLDPQDRTARTAVRRLESELARAPARGSEALVVLSEPLSLSHRQALEGLRTEWSAPLSTASAARPLPPGPHGVIIAFGGAAARRAREAGAPMVVALAPGFVDERGGATIRVEMTPSPERFVSVLAAAGVRRLLAVRAAPADPDFKRRAAAAGRRAGVVVEDALLPSAGKLPSLLRRAGGAADAVWLAPDPSAVTPATFETARAYARARSIPFFAPAPGLVSEEVRGELTVSFGACGREAARAARRLLESRPGPKVVYPP